MSDDRNEFSDEDLAAWIRGHPEIWADSGAERSAIDEEWVDRITDRVLPKDGFRARRHSRRLIGYGVAVLVVAGGTVGAAALLRDGQPSTPEAGPACRAEAEPDAEAVVLALSDDPVEACRRVWESGRFAQYMTPDGLPPLLACIGPHGAIEVFPGGPSVCSELGLVRADAGLTPDNQAVVRLSERLVESINAVGCVAVDEAGDIARQVIRELALTGWTVALEPGTQGGCAKAAVDSSTMRVVISNL